VRRRATAGVVVAGAAGALALRRSRARRKLARHYRVPSRAMEPTLEVGAHVTVDPGAYRDAPPERGDIVIFHPPPGSATSTCGSRYIPGRRACDRPIPGALAVRFIKRIVAVPGDRLSLREGFVYLDGRRFPEPYVAGPCRDERRRGCDLPEEIVVAPGHYFMLGDNRGASDDSRFWGPVAASAIVGRVRI
jgi:signal peptidase I